MYISRIKQFYNAVFSKMGADQVAFVKKHLDAKEQPLFFAMDRPTQTHSFRVAQTCLYLMVNKPAVNRDLLIKAALLHDIGKPANVIGTAHKVLIVLASRLPGAANFLINNKGCKLNLCKAFQAHYNHPLVGGNLARAASLSQELIYLIENHHREITALDSLELLLLRRADELN